jgi:hypothetical protein
MTAARRTDAGANGPMAAVGRVRACLEAHAKGCAEFVPPARQDPPELQLLASAFGLTDFERDVLVLAAGPELDPPFAECCATACGDPRRAYPTFGLALAALSGAHWSALLPARPLRRWRLVSVDAEDGLTTGRLRIAERVLHHLAGESYLDEALRDLVVAAASAGELVPSHQLLAERAAQAWLRTRAPAAWPLLQFVGANCSETEAVASAVCAKLGLWLYAVRADDLAARTAEARDALATIWDRESALSGVALFVDGHGSADPNANRAVAAFLDRIQGPVFFASAHPLRESRRESARLDVPRPSSAEQGAVWHAALGPRANDLNGQIGELVAQFRLSAPAIRTAAATVNGHAADRDALWEACRSEARPRLDDLAQRIETAVGWDDLVLPEAQSNLLRQVAAHVRGRSKVYDTWGFGARSARGLGITCLFAGPSGTGKTLAAEVLANHLRLDLYRIDLSQTVSKYIGETERNLARVFEAAEVGGAVLLFDEADALFGRRSEVKDSRDRYANLEVSYLLQRMETYHGLAVLTTNLKDALDPAFLRRLRFVVQFPFPDATQRAGIWARAFPAQTPRSGLDVARLARLAISGGNIRNIALSAAFLAAESGQPVRMAHVLQAARGEYAKLDKVLTEAEAGGWE